MFTTFKMQDNNSTAQDLPIPLECSAYLTCPAGTTKYLSKCGNKSA